MKNCPNCEVEMEDHFELCWNCNYSLSQGKVIEIAESTPGARELDCLRCGIPMIYSGKYKFHEGARVGILGNIFEIFLNREAFDLYLCPKCGKAEFFSPRTPD